MWRSFHFQTLLEDTGKQCTQQRTISIILSLEQMVSLHSWTTTVQSHRWKCGVTFSFLLPKHNTFMPRKVGFTRIKLMCVVLQHSISCQRKYYVKYWIMFLSLIENSKIIHSHSSILQMKSLTGDIAQRPGTYSAFAMTWSWSHYHTK